MCQGVTDATSHMWHIMFHIMQPMPQLVCQDCVLHTLQAWACIRRWCRMRHGSEALTFKHTTTGQWGQVGLNLA